MKQESIDSYKPSRDYERLWELLNAGQEVVCFVNHGDYDPPIRDICYARMDKQGLVDIGARGISYWYGPFSRAPSTDQFIKNCELIDLEFLDLGTLRCSSCGRTLLQRFNFCGKCGTAVNRPPIFPPNELLRDGDQPKSK